MGLESLERQAESRGPFQLLDARIKIVATIGFVIVVVATPVGSWRVLAIEAWLLAFLVGYSQISPRSLFGRWLGFVLLIGFLAAIVAQTHPERAKLGWATVCFSILAKNSLAFVAILTMAGTTPFRRLLVGLGQLGLPSVLVSTLHFMHRYLYVLNDELARMTQARYSRTFRRSGRLDWILLTGMIGMLLVRSFERGERVHAAMLARGWNGTIRSLDRPETERS